MLTYYIIVFSALSLWYIYNLKCVIKTKTKEVTGQEKLFTGYHLFVMEEVQDLEFYILFLENEPRN